MLMMMRLKMRNVMIVCLYTLKSLKSFVFVCQTVFAFLVGGFNPFEKY